MSNPTMSSSTTHLLTPEERVSINNRNRADGPGPGRLLNEVESHDELSQIRRGQFRPPLSLWRDLEWRRHLSSGGIAPQGKGVRYRLSHGLQAESDLVNYYGLLFDHSRALLQLLSPDPMAFVARALRRHDVQPRDLVTLPNLVAAHADTADELEAVAILRGLDIAQLNAIRDLSALLVCAGLDAASMDASDLLHFWDAHYQKREALLKREEKGRADERNYWSEATSYDGSEKLDESPAARLVQFRPTLSLWRDLEARRQERSHGLQAQDDLVRYYALLNDYARLLRTEFTPDEFALVARAIAPYEWSIGTLRLMPTVVAQGGAEGSALSQRLRAMPLEALLALRELIARAQLDGIEVSKTGIGTQIEAHWIALEANRNRLILEEQEKGKRHLLMQV